MPDLGTQCIVCGHVDAPATELIQCVKCHAIDLHIFPVLVLNDEED